MPRERTKGDPIQVRLPLDADAQVRKLAAQKGCPPSKWAEDALVGALSPPTAKRGTVRPVAEANTVPDEVRYAEQDRRVDSKTRAEIEEPAQAVAEHHIVPTQISSTGLVGVCGTCRQPIIRRNNEWSHR